MPTPEQLSDLMLVANVAEQFAADVIIIGATALQCFLDLPRFTNDIDLVVALDLADFAGFTHRLLADGWKQEQRREHRWRGPNNSLLDIVPAGPRLRASGAVVWPKSEFSMSLAGFEHVFTRAIETELGPGLKFRVAPPEVIALLKMVAYMENPERRSKDLDDLRFLLRNYQSSTDRIFSDEVFAAELEDIADAGAFLLGTDIRKFASAEETAVVRGFLKKQQLSAEELLGFDVEDLREQAARRFQHNLRAFSQGLFTSRKA